MSNSCIIEILQPFFYHFLVFFLWRHRGGGNHFLFRLGFFPPPFIRENGNAKNCKTIVTLNFGLSDKTITKNSPFPSLSQSNNKRIEEFYLIGQIIDSTVPHFIVSGNFWCCSCSGIHSQKQHMVKFADKTPYSWHSTPALLQAMLHFKM